LNAHPDLIDIVNLVYEPNGFIFSNPAVEKENIEYGGYQFELNGYSMQFRVAKTTPIKAGQFVTLYKRNALGPIQPYDIADPVDFFIISSRTKNHFGHFVFPKQVLVQQNIVSVQGRGGKRAIRVYSPWDKTSSTQSIKTQKWQLEYFLETPFNQPLDVHKLKELYRATQ